MLRLAILLLFVTCVYEAKDLAEISDYPWQVSVEEEGKNFAACGGVIISNLYILTGYECATRFELEKLVFRVNSSECLQGGTIKKARKYYTHPLKGQRPFEYDIAVVELDSPLTFGVGVQPIALPTAPLPVGAEAITTGYGQSLQDHLDGKNATRYALHRSKVIVVSDEVCRKKYEAFHVVLTEHMLCAQPLTSEVYRGDLGSPLQANGTLYGLISFGPTQHKDEIPDVFTNIFNLNDFITRIVHG